MAIDICYLEYQQQSQQAATDAAALGGAERASDDSCGNKTDVTSAAATDANLNGYSSSYVTVNNPPSSGPYANNDCAVAVTITKTKSTFFSHLWGMSGKESTQAVASYAAGTTGPGCIWLLLTGTSEQSNFSNSHLTMPHCAIYDNAFANYSNSTINAAYIGYASGTNDISGATFVNATPQPMSTVSDPCSDWSGCTWLTNNDPAGGHCTTNYNGNGGVQVGAPGSTVCYGNFSLSGSGNVACGIIEVTGSQFHVNNAGITSCSSGVTFALSSTVSDMNFSNATLTLAAPTTGNTADVLFWRNSSQSSAVDMSTCTCSLTGLVYYPTAQVDYSSSSGDYTLLVFGEMNISTTLGLNIGTPAPGYGSSSKVFLGE